MAKETVTLFLRVDPALVEKLDAYRSRPGTPWLLRTRTAACVRLLTAGLDGAGVVLARSAPVAAKKGKKR